MCLLRPSKWRREKTGKRYNGTLSNFLCKYVKLLASASPSLLSSLYIAIIATSYIAPWIPRPELARLQPNVTMYNEVLSTYCYASDRVNRHRTRKSTRYQYMKGMQGMQGKVSLSTPPVSMIPDMRKLSSIHFE